LGVDFLGVDILGVDFLGVDILGRTPYMLLDLCDFIYQLCLVLFVDAQLSMSMSLIVHHYTCRLYSIVAMELYSCLVNSCSVTFNHDD